MDATTSYALKYFAATAALSLVMIAQGCSSATTVTQPAATSAAADNRAADESAIRAQSATWSAASESKDLDKIVAFYSPDAVVLPDGGAIHTDAASIRQGWSGIANAKDASLGWKTTKVEVARSGDIAYEYGAYHLDITGKNGQVSTRHGKYVLVWKKQADGSWKVAVDTDNADAPPAAGK